jgi:hypothetical protein
MQAQVVDFVGLGADRTVLVHGTGTGREQRTAEGGVLSPGSHTMFAALFFLKPCRPWSPSSV